MREAEHHSVHELRGKLKVQIEVVPPGSGHLFDPQAHGQQGNPDRNFWSPDQAHPGLLGRPAPLFEIAGQTGCDDVRPFCLPALRTRNDMVVGEIFRLEGGATVLALPAIPEVKVLTGKLHERGSSSYESV